MRARQRAPSCCATTALLTKNAESLQNCTAEPRGMMGKALATVPHRGSGGQRWETELAVRLTNLEVLAVLCESRALCVLDRLVLVQQERLAQQLLRMPRLRV